MSILTDDATWIECRYLHVLKVRYIKTQIPLVFRPFCMKMCRNSIFICLLPIEHMNFCSFIIGPASNIIKLQNHHSLYLAKLFLIQWKWKWSNFTVVSFAITENIENIKLPMFRCINRCHCKLKNFFLTIETISKMKSLKTFRVNSLNRAQILQHDLILLAKELPLLTKIEFNSQYNRSLSVTFNGLKNMIQNGKQLKWIELLVNRSVSIYFKECIHKTNFDLPNINKKLKSAEAH